MLISYTPDFVTFTAVKTARVVVVARAKYDADPKWYFADAIYTCHPSFERTPEDEAFLAFGPADEKDPPEHDAFMNDRRAHADDYNPQAEFGYDRTPTSDFHDAFPEEAADLYF